jgi:hypothetical protein
MLKRTIVFAAFAGLAFTVITSAPAYAGICLNHKHAGTGKGPTKGSAKAAARAKWRYEVIKHKHPARILWSQSENQSTSCSKRVYGYTCKAKATACLPDATGQIGEGLYRKWRNVMGRCLDVAGGVNANRTNVQLFDCNGSKSQQWTSAVGGWLKNTMGRCLDVAGGVNANRTNVQLFDCNGSKSQKWTFTSSGEIRNVMGRCLEVAGGVNANRTNVQLFDCNGTKSQQWTQ